MWTLNLIKRPPQYNTGVNINTCRISTQTMKFAIHIKNCQMINFLNFRSRTKLPSRDGTTRDGKFISRLTQQKRLQFLFQCAEVPFCFDVHNSRESISQAAYIREVKCLINVLVIAVSQLFFNIAGG